MYNKGNNNYKSRNYWGRKQKKIEGTKYFTSFTFPGNTVVTIHTKGHNKKCQLGKEMHFIFIKQLDFSKGL